MKSKKSEKRKKFHNIVVYMQNCLKSFLFYYDHLRAYLLQYQKVYFEKTNFLVASQTAT